MKLSLIIRHLWPGVFVILAGCRKDGTTPSQTVSRNAITQVAANNFSLFLYYSALTSTGYSDTLNGPGPYTLLGLSNTAFQTAGFNSSTDIIHAADSMQKMIPYTVLRQRLAIDSTPMAFNQELTASDGKKLYLTHWANKRDTAVTVNGVRISTLSKPADNGLVNIADGLIYPSVFTDVQSAVSGDPNLTFFAAALEQSGVRDALKSGGPYTVFAPVNAAFMAAGIETTDSIYNMDPAVLKAVVLAHVAPGRSFVYDYILKADETKNTYAETMSDGSALTVQLVADNTKPDRFTGIMIVPAGGTAVGVIKSNVLADNGVVHSINSLLNKNF